MTPTRHQVLLGAIAAIAGVTGVATWLCWQRASSGTERAPIGPDTVVLLGDSLTEEGDWSRLLPGRPVANRGYSGFTTAELAPVAEEVARAGPAVVHLLTGTNDIRDGHPADWTIEHLTRILDGFARSSPDTVVVVQTLLPRADAAAEVVEVNERIVALARSRDLPVLDLHPHFDDGRGGLRPEETTDGLHLTEAGYRRWADLLAESPDGS